MAASKRDAHRVSRYRHHFPVPGLVIAIIKIANPLRPRRRIQHRHVRQRRRPDIPPRLPAPPPQPRLPIEERFPQIRQLHFFGFAFPAFDRLIAILCFWGYPSFRSLEIFELIAAFDDPRFSGMFPPFYGHRLNRSRLPRLSARLAHKLPRRLQPHQKRAAQRTTS